MRIYWSLSCIPELADLRPKDRRRAWRYASLRTIFRPVLLLSGIAVVISIKVFVNMLILQFGPNSPVVLLIGLPVAAFTGLAYWSLIAHWCRPKLRRFVEQELSERPKANTTAT